MFPILLLIALGTGRIAASQAPAALASKPADAQVNELDERLKFVLATRRLVDEEKFGELEGEAERLRAGRVHMPDGTWKLEVFFQAVSAGASAKDEASREKHLKHLQHWSQAKPKSVVPLLALAMAYEAYAWRELSKDGDPQQAAGATKSLGKHREQVLRYLLQAEKLDPAYPELCRFEVNFYRMIDRAEEATKAFKRGVEKEPLYYALYDVRTGDLLPRWHGKPGDVEKFAAWAGDYTRKWERDALYARVAFVADRLAGPKVGTTYHLDWERVKRGFKDIEKLYPHSTLNLNFFAKYACDMNDRPVAREYFKRIDPKWTSEGSRSDKAEAWLLESRFRAWRRWALDQGEHPFGSPLHIAIRSGDLAGVRRLLETDVDVDAKNTGGQTPLMMACLGREEEMAGLLIERKSNVNAVALDGNAALHYATSMGLTNTARELLKRGASPTRTEKNSAFTPLHLAALSGREEIVRLLLACKNVDINAQSRNGNTPLHLAVLNGRTAVVKLLLEREDVEVNAAADGARTPLHCALEKNQNEIVAMLLARGADPRLKNDQGRTPLDAARTAGNKTAVQLLENVAASRPAE